MGEDRDKLVKDLKKAEQEIGVLRHKLKQRKEDKNEFNTTLLKLQDQNREINSDLALAYKNLEKLSNDCSALRKVFKILKLDGEDSNAFNEAIAH